LRNKKHSVWLLQFIIVLFWILAFASQPQPQPIYRMNYQTINFVTDGEVDNIENIVHLKQVGEKITTPKFNPGVYQIVITIIGVQIAFSPMIVDQPPLGLTIGEFTFDFSVLTTQVTLYHHFALVDKTDIILSLNNFATINQEDIPLSIKIGQMEIYQT
jgi:hypothetical protein